MTVTGVDFCFINAVSPFFVSVFGSSRVLEKVCVYLVCKAKYLNNQSANVPMFHVEPDIASEVVMAAQFLDC